MGDVDDGGGQRGGGCACAEEGADDAVLCVCATEIVVEDGEKRGRVDRQRCRAGSVAGASATSETATTTTYGLTSAPCWTKIADEVGPNGIVASSDQKLQRSCNPPCFFYTHALRRDKRPFSPFLTPPTLTISTGTHPQGRRVRSRTLPFALHTEPS